MASLTVSPAGAPRGERYKRAGAYAAVGGGVMLIGAALFAIDAHQASESVEATYKRGGRWDEVQAIDSRGQRSERTARVLGAGGGVALISAAVLYGLGRHHEPANRLAIAPTKTGAQASLSWAF
jgi:hypothetical protein